MTSSHAMSAKAAIRSPVNPLRHRSMGLHGQHHFNPPHNRCKRRFPVLAQASSISLPINVDYLEKEFSGHGVTFQGIGDSCVVRMGLENGSAASLMLPSGLVTSYKPSMWHGATAEVLHTTVSEGEKGEAVVQGGLSTNFEIEGDSGMPWSPRKWSLQSIDGSPDKSIQVQLVSVAPGKMAEVKCVVTLRQDLLGSELTIVNPASSALQLSGSFVTHLKVSTPDATYAAGLQGSNYHGKQPVLSDFSIIPPDFSRRIPSNSNQSWAKKALQSMFSSLGDADQKEDDGRSEESEGEEDDDYVRMTEKMSRIYTNSPRDFTVIDRGRRNSVVIRRSGLEEFYVFSPGSEYEWYGKYAYICLGPSAILTPLSIDPGCVWQGAQFLYNPNL